MKRFLGLIAGIAAAALPIFAQDGVLELKGLGAGGKKPYQGGKVEFLEVALADQVVHLATPETIPLRLSIRYKVLETAPVLLNSRMGTEFWRLYQYGGGGMSELHTRERIDLSTLGEATTAVQTATIEREATRLAKGMAGIRGHHYFLVDQADGQWLDVARPPPFFNRPELARKLVFTLANLTSFSLAIPTVESTWTPAGPFRVKLVLTDADGDALPVVTPDATVRAGTWTARLRPEMDDLNSPTGWLVGLLPKTAVPDQVDIHLRVSAMTPNGPVKRDVSRTVKKGEGQKTALALATAAGLPAFPRTPAGIIRETRAIWVNPRAFQTKHDVDALVERTAAAGLNMIVADIFVRSIFLAQSDLHPMSAKVEEGLDPLGRLIEKAHEKGIEVHPWFCVTYRDPKFRRFLPGVDLVDRKGVVAKLAVDVHRPKYRDFIVGLMVDVATRYPVDGIHLDYIRAMEQCYCAECRKEFQQQFGKPLTEASAEDWMVWQRQAVGDIVRRTAAGVRKVRPSAKLSAAVFSDLRPGAAGALQGQDPGGWAAKGWLDLVIPMDYSMDSLSVRAIEQGFLAILDDDTKLVTGLSLYTRNGTEVSSRSPDLVGQQIRLVRRLGIHGYCLFELSHLDDALLESFKTEHNRERAIPYFR